MAAQRGDWIAAQEACSGLAMLAPPVGPLARLNILVCQYHLGHTQLIAERVLPLLQHIPSSASLTCAGLALLAARKAGTLHSYQGLLAILANEENTAFDLPTVPIFIKLQSDMQTCGILESHDCALMCEIVQTVLDSNTLSEGDAARLKSLAERCRTRTAATALSHLCTVIDLSMARLLANSQRPDRPPVRCIDVARHAPGVQPTLLQESSRPNSRSHLV